MKEIRWSQFVLVFFFPYVDIFISEFSLLSKPNGFFFTVVCILLNSNFYKSIFAGAGACNIELVSSLFLLFLSKLCLKEDLSSLESGSLFYAIDSSFDKIEPLCGIINDCFLSMLEERIERFLDIPLSVFSYFFSGVLIKVTLDFSPISSIIL